MQRATVASLASVSLPGLASSGYQLPPMLRQLVHRVELNGSASTMATDPGARSAAARRRRKAQTTSISPEALAQLFTYSGTLTSLSTLKTLVQGRALRNILPMSALQTNFVTAERAKAYADQGPPAFAPGHAGLLQMIGVLLSESMPHDGAVLVIGVGGGLETRYLAEVEPEWRFVGVDPAEPMLEMARVTAGPVAGRRLSFVRGTVSDAPLAPFDAATCILVLGLIADDGGKLDLLVEARRRLKPGSPFILVDQCLDRSAPDFQKRLERYAAFARRSGVADDVVAKAAEGVGALQSMVPPQRNEELLIEAGFRNPEVFYVAMAWHGWLSRA